MSNKIPSNTGVVLVAQNRNSLYDLFASERGIFLPWTQNKTEDDVCRLLSKYTRCIAMYNDAFIGIYVHNKVCKDLVMHAVGEHLTKERTTMTKTKAEFVAMIQRHIEEGYPVYVAVSFPIGDGDPPYVRSFPVLEIKESPNGYQCYLQGYGVGEVVAGTSFSLPSPNK